MKKILGLVFFVGSILVITIAIIIYARGYRPNLGDKTLKGTGIVSIKTNPTEAKVFIDGKEKGTSELNIANLTPGEYSIKLTKEGFSSWEKKVLVKKERVNLIEITLFPLAPNLQAITFLGVKNPIPSPKGDKVVFAASQAGRLGLWSLTLNGRNLPIFFSREQNQIVVDTTALKFSDSTIRFSPDGKELLAKLPTGSFFLLKADDLNDKPRQLTETDATKTQAGWDKSIADNTTKQIKALGKKAEEISAVLKEIKFSNDNLRFFGTKTTGEGIVVYDSKPTFSDSEAVIYELPKASYLWYPDNKHLIMIEDSLISVVDLDIQNKISLYTGSFEKGFFVPWPDGSKIAILTNLNKSQSSLPNIYAIELR